MPTGIYKITNISNNKIYIGSSVDMLTRWSQHKYYFRNEKHQNIHLQRAYNKYGEQSFVFEILENCEPDKLIEREQVWIDWLKPQYNKRKDASSNLGIKYSEETKIKMSAWQTGRKMSDEARANMSKGQRRKSKWKCEDGMFCKCDNCKTLMREYKKNYMRNKRQLKVVLLNG